MEVKVIKATTEEEKQKSFAIREEVFIVEQKVDPDEEFDEYEDSSHHFVALDRENEPVGSARWRRTEKGIKLERFTVKKNVRKKGIGSQIIQAVLDDISENEDKDTYLYMHAQLDAVPLYAKFGFQKQGDQFNECGIMHYLMWYKL